MVFCEKCGKENVDNANFCFNCGSKIKKDNVKQLINDLTSSNKVMRNIAVQSLVDIGEPAFKAVLQASLSDDPVTRRKTCDFFGQFGDPRGVMPLMRLLTDNDKHVRRRAANALISVGDDRALGDLIKALDDSEEKVRSRAAEALVNIGEPAFKVALDSSYSYDAVTRRKTCDFFGQFGDPRGVMPLMRLLTDNDKHVRESAANALISVGDERALGDLIKALDDSEEKVRSRAAEALGNIGDMRALSSLKKMSNDPSNSVQDKAFAAINNIYFLNNSNHSNKKETSVLEAPREELKNETSPEKTKRLIQISINDLSSSSRDTRNSAVQSLVNIGEPAFDAVLKASKSDDNVVKRKTCDFFGQFGDPRGVMPLVRLLIDDNKHVRRRAANALISIGDERAVIRLIYALNDSETKVRLRSAKALGKIGDNRAIEPLCEHLEDISSSVSEAVNESLKEFGPEGKKAIENYYIKKEEEKKRKKEMEEIQRQQSEKRRQRENEEKRRKEALKQKERAEEEERINAEKRRQRENEEKRLIEEELRHKIEAEKKYKLREQLRMEEERIFNEEGYLVTVELYISACIEQERVAPATKYLADLESKIWNEAAINQGAFLLKNQHLLPASRLDRQKYIDQVEYIESKISSTNSMSILNKDVSPVPLDLLFNDGLECAILKMTFEFRKYPKIFEISHPKLLESIEYTLEAIIYEMVSYNENLPKNERKFLEDLALKLSNKARYTLDFAIDEMERIIYEK